MSAVRSCPRPNPTHSVLASSIIINALRFYLCVCPSVTDVGVAVTNLWVVCKIITCVSAFFFFFFIVKHVQGNTMQIERVTCCETCIQSSSSIINTLRFLVCVCPCVTDVGVAVTNLRVVCKIIACRVQNYRVRSSCHRNFLEIVKAAAGQSCRLREGCHCGRLPLH